MTVHTVFCSACDRNVALVPHTPDWTWRIVMARNAAGEVACMERGTRCTGTLCPFCAVIPNGGDREEARRAGALPVN
jgi:hypothetical protein